ncbi:hypothetical protein [Adlercreutzia sp. ZJ304]|uniref:hypothetical protein n=1 Tax=Adlercreutzia sp. ZJ304 TaxID=2709791 RepID=UPI0013E9FC0B|nr:hypothetical protein [Adlercreutzia sp. ZJ304]
MTDSSNKEKTKCDFARGLSITCPVVALLLVLGMAVFILSKLESLFNYAVSSLVDKDITIMFVTLVVASCLIIVGVFICATLLIRWGMKLAIATREPNITPDMLRQESNRIQCSILTASSNSGNASSAHDGESNVQE